MSSENFLNQVISPWMRQEGRDSDIVLSTRIRYARNIDGVAFPTAFTNEDNERIIQQFENKFANQVLSGLGKFELVKMVSLKPEEKQVLVEKHLISPHLAFQNDLGAVLISENEEVSIMINEEDHLRIQCLFPGLQLKEALEVANSIDNWLESEMTFAFHEKIGYLTSCPSNVGTGLRASVMLHLPGIVSTGQSERIIRFISKMGLVVRGVHGEGSQSTGNIFQISNQVTLGKSELVIIEELERVVLQIILYERQTREASLEQTRIQLEDNVFRSLGTLQNARKITSEEAAFCLSQVRVGIDLGVIKDIPRNVFNELIVAIQPGCLQRFSGKKLSPEERDIFRANLIREQLNQTF
ncbi:MAG: ATP:guanido phosphotransferase [Bacillales bacterium]|nr:ATP:guanido phosphotransferase [Bacillales bacterium]